MFAGPLLETKLYLLVLFHSMDFKAPHELLKQLDTAVPGKFHRFCGHSKRNCLQDQANFHRSRACQIVLIFNAGLFI